MFYSCAVPEGRDYETGRISGNEHLLATLYTASGISPAALLSELVNEDGSYETILFVLPKCQRKHVADVDAKILIGFA